MSLRGLRSRAGLLALLRAALLVIVFHASGAAHLAADVYELVTTGHHAGTPFDDDDDAPNAPGSPACHHAQPGAASLAFASHTRLAAPSVERTVVAKWHAFEPPTPALRNVYRPPRA